MRHNLHRFLLCSTLLVLFVILPFSLMALGFSRTITLSFVIGLAALLTDGLLTKVGLRQKCFELNPLFRVLKSRLKENYMLVISRIVGAALLLSVLFLFNDEFLLLVFAMSLMTCVIANSVSLVFIDHKVGDCNED